MMEEGLPAPEPSEEARSHARIRPAAATGPATATGSATATQPPAATGSRAATRWAAGLAAFGRRLAGRLFGRLGVPGREWACVVPIMLLAAADRFVNLPARGIWDMDQGFELGAIWNAVQARQLPTFGSPAFSTGGTFHHGAMFYDLMMPVSWATNGSPTAIITEIALFGFVVVPLIWWTARSIGGTSAGLAAALLAAVSPSFIDYSTFIWNPVLVEPGVALACFGAWQAWKTRGPRWWVVAAAGTALASQSHLTGLALVFPMAILFLVTLWRSPAGSRRRLLAWGMAGVGLFALTWLPWIVFELTHDFAETRAMLAFSQPGPPAADPLTRFVISTIRILAWPLTHWPLSGLSSGFPVALAVATGVMSGLIWRVTGALVASREGSLEGAGGESGPTGDAPAQATGEAAARPGAGQVAPREREGLLFIGGSLLLMTAILGLGIKEISQFSNLNQEQYHSVADVFVILAAGLVVSGLWRAAPLHGRPWSGHFLASVALASLVVVGVGNWQPLTAPDGGWPAAQVATARLERDTAGQELALIALPTFIPADAYGYPLRLDGVSIVAPAVAGTIVILCYPGWADGCGGSAEAGWLAANLPGRDFTLRDQWQPAPGRFLSVYRRAP